ncbi:MAG TPA: hypothetical protein VFR32_05350 [Gaiellaceae bacterium]|nr:hypothetical protein [Gaiellaceae bacterium]
MRLTGGPDNRARDHGRVGHLRHHRRLLGRRLGNCHRWLGLLDRHCRLDRRLDWIGSGGRGRCLVSWRSGIGNWRGHRSRRWRRTRVGRSARRPSRRQEGQRIDVPLGVGGHADAEMDVRAVVLGRSARSDRTDGRAFSHRVSLADRDRAEVYERHGVAVAGLDRDHTSVRAHVPRERDRAGRRREHRRSSLSSDVDPSMLSPCIGIVADDEGREDLPVGRPSPGARGCGHRERSEDDDGHHQTLHASPPCFRFRQQRRR